MKHFHKQLECIPRNKCSLQEFSTSIKKPRYKCYPISELCIWMCIIKELTVENTGPVQESKYFGSGRGVKFLLPLPLCWSEAVGWCWWWYCIKSGYLEEPPHLIDLVVDRWLGEKLVILIIHCCINMGRAILQRVLGYVDWLFDCDLMSEWVWEFERRRLGARREKRPLGSTTFQKLSALT